MGFRVVVIIENILCQDVRSVSRNENGRNPERTKCQVFQDCTHNGHNRPGKPVRCDGKIKWLNIESDMKDGSYLAELLISKGYDVHGIVRRSSSFNTMRIEHLYADRKSHVEGCRCS
jgi:hypothetical protein